MSFGRIALAFCTVVVGCNDRDPVAPVASANNVAIRLEDGTAITFASTVRAWCGPWEGGLIPEPTVHVVVGSATARWEFRAVRRDVRIGEELTFPNTFIWDQPRGAEIFVHDPPNELSTQTSGSSGGVVIEHLDCRGGGGVRFRVDAVIGSEFGDLPGVTVTGSFSSPWTGPPTG
jgi:hypothetical protein